MENSRLHHILNSLPGKPGIYQFFDCNGTIIYIGKAKNLKKRIVSYFKGNFSSGKTAVMIGKTDEIKYIVVDSEADALLLENNLIKKYQPRYNILLKDDKTFPWICVKKEHFPRVFSTRTVLKDGSHYFGPYTSVRLLHTLLELIKKLYPLRNCNYKLSEENIKTKKYKLCLEYHIGNCKGPCEGLQTEEDYEQSILNIKDILKGNIVKVIGYLKTLMKDFSADYEFEKAQIVKEKLGLLEKFQKKSTIVNPEIDNVDVFSIVTDEKYGYVNYLKVLNGAIIQIHTIELKKQLDETPEDLLLFAITDIRQRFQSESPEIIISFEINVEIPGVKFIVPKIGDKKKLLELSQRNVQYYQQEKQRQAEELKQKTPQKRILEQMKKDLHLKELPLQIECFDNSNIQGSQAVAAMAVFKNAKPAKSEYRHFNIKTVEGIDDFASMKEVVFRRYRRLLEEKKTLPQLIVVDGGIGQLNSAVAALGELKLKNKIAIIGIAKKLESIFFPGDSVPLFLDKKSETLKVIQQIRNETHRFGITHHRGKREKETIKTEITGIKGIAGETARKLLTEFKSVANVKKAKFEEIEKIIGKAKAKIVFEYFRK
ncbi:MAG: excinuclease ABC subunit UvrC [Bacteroidales bacterium]|nr:excinuclease ABC subunit UvrC [Bacteroidales bacterium]